MERSKWNFAKGALQVTKTEFESLLDSRAKDMHRKKIILFWEAIEGYFRANPEMNAQEEVNHTSMYGALEKFVKTAFDVRKEVTLKKLKENELNRILSDLENVKLLFQGHQ